MKPLYAALVLYALVAGGVALWPTLHRPTVHCTVNQPGLTCDLYQNGDLEGILISDTHGPISLCGRRNGAPFRCLPWRKVLAARKHVP